MNMFLRSCALLLAGFALATSSATAQTRMQAAASSPVFARPSADSKPLGTANSGEILFVSRVDGDWAAISPPERFDLWLNKDFIEDYRVVAKSIQIRSGPGIQFDVVGVLERGAPVMPRGEEGDWCKIAPPSSSILWIKRGNLAEVQASAAPIREVAAAPAPTAAAVEPAPAKPESKPSPSPKPEPAATAVPVEPAPQTAQAVPPPAPRQAAAAPVKVAPSTPHAPAPKPPAPAARPQTPAPAPEPTSPSPMAAAPAQPAPAPTAVPPPAPAPTPVVRQRMIVAVAAPRAEAPPAAKPTLRPATALPAPAPSRAEPPARKVAVVSKAVPAPAAAVAAQKPREIDVSVDQALVDDLDLLDQPNQGASVQIEGELRAAPPFTASAPSRYRLLAYDKDVLEMVCHVHGDSSVLRQYIGKNVSIRGREYWVENSDMPVVVVGQIVPLAPADVDEPVMF